MQSLIRFPPVIEKNCDFLLRLHSSLIYDDNDDDVDDYDDMLQDRKNTGRQYFSCEIKNALKLM